MMQRAQSVEYLMKVYGVGSTVPNSFFIELMHQSKNYVC